TLHRRGRQFKARCSDIRPDLPPRFGRCRSHRRQGAVRASGCVAIDSRGGSGGVMKDIHELFADKKPLIAMVHLLPTLGTPLYDAQLGMEGNVKHVREDLEILLEAGFDALLFCNEGDRPYSFRAGYEGVATMTRVVTELAPTD